MNWLRRLFTPSDECHHTFRPVMHPDDPQRFLGQECSICHRFNPVDSVIPGYTARYLKEKSK